MKKYDLRNMDREQLADALEQEMREAGLGAIDDGVEKGFDDDDDFDPVPTSGSTAMAKSLNEREPPIAARAFSHSIRTSDEVSGDTIEIEIVNSRGRRLVIALCWDGESARWSRLSTQQAQSG